jgi:iron complex transport system permease protein
MNRHIHKQGIVFPVLLLLLVIVALASMRLGAVSIDTETIFSALRNLFDRSDAMSLNERIFLDIRLPRVLLCIVVGAALAVGGVLMQAIFRNPIVEPGLVGTSSGAAFGAALCLVLGATFDISAGTWLLPISAFSGALLSTFLVVLLSRPGSGSGPSVLVLLLTGIAINALFMSGVGFLAYIARDPQARSITFWNLGSLSGANWQSVAITGTVSICCIALSARHGNRLNALAMGEEEARYLGVNTQRLRTVIILLNILMVAVSTAFTGIIGFVGLITPHLLRITGGSDNNFLIRNAAVLGGLLVCLADLVARTALAPAELPIGIVTALVGAPVFITLVRRKQYFF